MSKRNLALFTAVIVASFSCGSSHGQSLLGPEWVEDQVTPEAGSTLDDAQNTSGGPITKIRGSLSLSFGSGESVQGGFDAEDVYLIFIDDPANFLASTEITFGGNAEFDSALYLFDADGLGLLGNDDAESNEEPSLQGSSLSTLNNMSNDGTNVDLNDVGPGLYYLAVSYSFRRPQGENGPIFQFTSFGEVSGPDGPGGGDPLDNWQSVKGVRGDQAARRQGGPEAYVISLAGVRAAMGPIGPDRGDATSKGSLLVYSKIDVRWDAAGFLVQDTFINLANDYPEDVRVQMYLVNGDEPLEADGGERAHPGWNFVDNQFELTGNEPTYWSAATGQPKGVAPFAEALDPGFPPGRPATDGSGDRVMRGLLYLWAVNSSNEEIRWNHLAGSATIVNYRDGSAAEYNAWTFPVVDPNVPHGQNTGSPGELFLDGTEFASAFSQLLLNFVPSGSAAYSGPAQVTADTALALHPAPADLRQETDGPVTTKAHFDVWNANEVKFSEAFRCVTCWDCTLLSQYGIPNNFTLGVLGTDSAELRVQGLASQLCNVDFDPNNNDDFPFPPQVGDPEDNRDVVSVDAPLLGVAVKRLDFDGGLMRSMAATNLLGLGQEIAVVAYDVPDAPPELNFTERKKR